MERSIIKLILISIIVNFIWWAFIMLFLIQIKDNGKLIKTDTWRNYRNILELQKMHPKKKDW